MFMGKLIGITGLKGTGKDTLGGILEHSKYFRRHAFADPIKEALAVMYSVDISLFHNPAVKEAPLPELFGRTPRHLMQTMGTEWGRDLIDRDLWVKLCFRRLMEESKAGCDKFVITDVRFDAEAQAIREIGGEIWEITRKNRCYTREDSHRSEDGISSSLVTATLVNDGSVESLARMVEVLLGQKDTKR